MRKIQQTINQKNNEDEKKWLTNFLQTPFEFNVHRKIQQK
jgi:hypothetical protein